MLPTLSQITAFNAVVEKRSFSGAAIALGVTQSAVTQNVLKLEKTAGLVLFNRGRSNLSLTPRGAQLHSVTVEIGFLSKLLEDTINEFSKLNTGTLRIAAASASPAMPIIREFRYAHPKIDVIFQNTSWRRCAELLKARDVDIAIMPAPGKDDPFHSWKLDERRHSVLLHQSHTLATKSEISLSELTAETMVFSSNRSFARSRVASAAKRLGLSFSYTMVVEGAPMVLEAVRHRLGIAVSYADPCDLPHGVLSIPIVEFDQPFEVCACCMEGSQDLHLVRAFVDCLRPI